MGFKDVVCKECGEVINVDIDKHVLIGTYNGDHVLDESYYHFDCFVKWYNKKVSEKAKNSVKHVQNKVQGLMENPKISGLMSMIGGTKKLKSMLNTNLDVSNENMDIKEMVTGLFDSVEKPKENVKKDTNGTKKGKPKPKQKTKM